MLNINNYLPELVAVVEIKLGATTAKEGHEPFYKIQYLAEPPVAIPQLKRGIAFMYGGTQFGDYQDLGDGRSALVDDRGCNGVVIAKGCLTTPYTKFGNGDYYLQSARSCSTIQQQLKDARIDTEETLAIYKVAHVHKATAIIIRSCPYRIGTFEYMNRHHSDKVKSLWDNFIVNYIDPDHNPIYCYKTDHLFKEIIKDYGRLYKKWHEAGFVHGCLNTDNMSALPQTIDVQHSFFSFRDGAHSEIDITGRYSRENQENAVLFGLNKYRLSLQSLFPDYTAEDMYKDFKDV